MKPKAPNEHEDGMLEYMEDIIGGYYFKKSPSIFCFLLGFYFPKKKTLSSQQKMVKYLKYLKYLILSGTNVYKQPIEELATKVEELNEARGEKVCDCRCIFTVGEG